MPKYEKRPFTEVFVHANPQGTWSKCYHDVHLGGMAFDSYDVHGQLEIKQNQVEGFMEVYAISPPPPSTTTFARLTPVVK